MGGGAYRCTEWVGAYRSSPETASHQNRCTEWGGAYRGSPETRIDAPKGVGGDGAYRSGPGTGSEIRLRIRPQSRKYDRIQNTGNLADNNHPDDGCDPGNNSHQPWVGPSRASGNLVRQRTVKSHS